MSEPDRAGHVEALIAHLLGARGETERALREAALADRDLPPELAELVHKIHHHAYRVTDEEIAGLRARFSDDQLFEVIVLASVGAARERFDAGMRALAEVP